MVGRVQFRLPTLFFVFVVVASTVAVFGWWSVFALPVICGIAGFTRYAANMKHPFLAFAILVVAICIPAVFALSLESHEDIELYACNCQLARLAMRCTHTVRDMGLCRPTWQESL